MTASRILAGQHIAWAKKILFSVLFLVFIFYTYRLKRTATPYFYIGLEVFLLLVFLTLRTKRPANFKAFLFNLAVLVLCCTVAEAYFAGWFSLRGGLKHYPASSSQGTYFTQNMTYFQPDAIRGYAGGKNVRVSARVLNAGQLVYDVTYTTNGYGLRVSPHDLSQNRKSIDNPHRNAVFFGCSFTVGEGLNDDETLPYLFEAKSEGKYWAYNFGFHGYGPHQMLRILESGLVDRVTADKKISLSVYSCITAHVERATCNYPYVTWDVNGPRYRLNARHEIEYAGRFSDNYLIKLKGYLNSFMAKSPTLMKADITRRLFEWPRTPTDLELFIKIIAQSEEIISQKYHGHFIVILWDLPGDKDHDYILSELKKNNIDVITTTEIFQNHKDNPNDFFLNQNGHPSRLANERLSQFLLDYATSKGWAR